MDKLFLNTKTSYIKNDSVKTIDFILLFPTKYDKKDKHALRILKMFIGNYSNKFPTEKEYKKELAKHMIINLSMSSRSIGNNLYIRFDLTLPMDNIIDGYDIEDSFKFFVESIYNPLVEEGHLDTNKFEREKEFLRTKIIDSNRSIYGVSFNRLIELIDEKEEIFDHYETSLRDLDNTDSKNTYELYNNNVLNGKFISYVYGNFDRDKVEKIFNKYLPHDEEEMVIDKDYRSKYRGNKKKFIEERSKFNQTALYMVYSVKDLKNSEIEYLSLIGNILGNSENDLIFKALRLDNELVYSSNVTKYVYSGLMIIETYLQYKNYKKATELIRDTIESLKDEKILKECIDRLLRGIEISLLKASDSKYFKIENKIDEDFDLRPLQDIYDAYKEMDLKEVIKFLDRLEENLVFVYRGENDEEE